MALFLVFIIFHVHSLQLRARDIIPVANATPTDIIFRLNSGPVGAEQTRIFVAASLKVRVVAVFDDVVPVQVVHADHTLYKISPRV